MNSVEMLEILDECQEYAFDDEFLVEIPNHCLVKFVENRGWDVVESNLSVDAVFYGIDEEYKRIIIPSDNIDWIDTLVRWLHNIKVLTEYYDADRCDIVRWILEG